MGGTYFFGAPSSVRRKVQQWLPIQVAIGLVARGGFLPTGEGRSAICHARPSLRPAHHTHWIAGARVGRHPIIGPEARGFGTCSTPC
jgi:hypothetical protein